MDKKFDEAYPCAIMTVNGKEVIYSHYQDCKGHKEMVAKFKDQIEFVKKNDHLKLMLVNYIGAAVGREFMAISKDHIHLWDSIKTAVIGIEGIKKILLMGYNNLVKNKMPPFNSAEEALEFLTVD